MTTVRIFPEYGYIGFVGVASGFLLAWLGGQVMKARKLYKVEYPTMYENSKPEFNCYQRAHQNALESYPSFLLSLALGGIRHPLISAGFGAVWVVARVLYAFGYYSGKPQNREVGSIIAGLALMGLYGTTISTSLQLLNIY